MANQMTPAEMRGFAFDLRLTVDVMVRHQQLGSSEIRAMRAGADALEALAAIKDMLPGPRTFAESLARDHSGQPFPRLIDADKVTGIIAGAFAHGEVRDVS